MTEPIDTPPSDGKLHISNESANYLRETGSWGNFLAIVGFCFVGLMVLVALFASTLLAALGTSAGISTGFLSVFYLAFAALYFFPVLYLYKFASTIKQALLKRDSILLATSLENLKSLFKFMGIMTAIMLGLYLLVLIGGVLGAALF